MYTPLQLPRPHERTKNSCKLVKLVGRKRRAQRPPAIEKSNNYNTPHKKIRVN
jgi:hypothetical protein